MAEGARHLPRATELLEHARRLAPTRPESALNLVLAYVKANRLPEALQLARQAVEDLPPELPQDAPLRTEAVALLKQLQQA